MAAQSAKDTRVLVIGAYGLIGSNVVRHLLHQGCFVSGLGRNLENAKTVFPDMSWIIHDLADLCEKDNWQPILEDVDYVVNCAGALQAGPDDDLETVHSYTVTALAAACNATKTKLIQISAVGAVDTATTPFLRTKAIGDAAIRQSGAVYWIFKPGLVLALSAYGGTALIRSLAAVPVVQPLAKPDAPIQTVAVTDLCRAISLAISGKIAASADYDLIEEQSHSLTEIIAAHRRWMGFSAAKRNIILPDFLASLTAKFADCFGLLGWRSPLRSSSLAVLDNGVLGSPIELNKAAGFIPSSLNETLSTMQATAETRWFSRSTLLMPLAVGTLFVFWFLSGALGFFKLDQAAANLTDIGWSPLLANTSVIFWSIIDIGLAVAILIRKFAAKACIAMIVVSLIYLCSATLLLPDLWVDPLGPLVKIFPGMTLALITRAMLEIR